MSGSSKLLLFVHMIIQLLCYLLGFAIFSNDEKRAVVCTAVVLFPWALAIFTNGHVTNDSHCCIVNAYFV